MSLLCYPNLELIVYITNQKIRDTGIDNPDAEIIGVYLGKFQTRFGLFAKSNTTYNYDPSSHYITICKCQSTGVIAIFQGNTLVKLLYAPVNQEQLNFDMQNKSIVFADRMSEVYENKKA